MQKSERGGGANAHRRERVGPCDALQLRGDGVRAPGPRRPDAADAVERIVRLEHRAATILHGIRYAARQQCTARTARAGVGSRATGSRPRGGQNGAEDGGEEEKEG